PRRDPGWPRPRTGKGRGGNGRRRAGRVRAGRRSRRPRRGAAAGPTSTARTRARAAGCRASARRPGSATGTRRPGRDRGSAGTRWRRGPPRSEQPLLLLLLAGDAVLGPGHGLQALAVHLVFADDAHAEAPALHAVERLVDELEHVALVVRQAEEELLGVGVAGLVRDVLRPVLVGLLAVGLVLVVGLEDLLLLEDQLLPERLELFLFHFSRGLLSPADSHAPAPEQARTQGIP